MSRGTSANQRPGWQIFAGSASSLSGLNRCRSISPSAPSTPPSSRLLYLGPSPASSSFFLPQDTTPRPFVTESCFPRGYFPLYFFKQISRPGPGFWASLKVAPDETKISPKIQLRKSRKPKIGGRKIAPRNFLCAPRFLRLATGVITGAASLR